MHLPGTPTLRGLRHLCLLGALLATLAASTPAASAQTPPSSDQGPRFGQWGPGQAPPDAEGPAGADAPTPPNTAPAYGSGPEPGARSAAPDTGRSAAPDGGRPFAAPGAPGLALPPAPGPAPDRWGGCNYDLRGSWQISGRQTDPYPYSYSSWVHVRQFRSWLQIEQPDDNLSYYGICRGDTIELDVYAGGRFVGYEDGVVTSSGGWSESASPWGRARFGPWSPPSSGMRVRAEWTSFFGPFASGNETWYRW